jgi:putative glutamine amidotransferase
MRKKNKNRPLRAAPLILVAPSTERVGAEFADWSVSLSRRYTDAIIAAGGLPLIMPATTRPEVIADLVRRCDGVLMTGGDDLDPKLYVKRLPPELAKTTGEHDTQRDIWEKILIEQVFEQRKPMFGICRGHQMLNVALGGTLVVDIPIQMPNSLDHNQMAKKTKPVHDTSVTPDSLLAKITGKRNLRVNSTHHQAIGRLADALKSVAQSADGPRPDAVSIDRAISPGAYA